MAPICAPPHPDKLRRGDPKEQTPRTTPDVLTTRFDVDPYQMLPAFVTDVLPSQSRWTSPEPPASPRNVSGMTDATGPGECASNNGPVHEAAVRQEKGQNQPRGMREAPNRFSGGVSDTPPDFAHETRNTASIDGTKENCTRDIVFFWQPLHAFRNGRLPVSRSKAFLIPAVNNSSLQKETPLRGSPDATTHHARVQPSPPQAIW